MGNERQKLFNKHMDDYIKRLPREKASKKKKKKPQEPKVRMDRAEMLEEKELEKAEERTTKRTLGQSIKNWLFGSKAIVEEEPYEEKLSEEEVPEAGVQKVTSVKRDKNYMDFIKRVLWGSSEDSQPEDDSIQKLVLYKPRAEQEVKFLIELVEHMMGSMNKSKKEFYLKSKEYRIFQEIKQRNLGR